MTHDLVDLKRFVLEQDFLNERGKIEKHRTAVVSIIGDEPTDELHSQLAKLNYAEGRFSTLTHSGFAGRWVSKSTKELPDFALGLIIVTTRSEAALERLESEANQYWNAAMMPFIAWPGSIRFANLIKRQLAEHDQEWHIVRLNNGNAEPSAKDMPSAAIVYIESLLVAGTYPGIACVDSADVLSVFSDRTSAQILRFDAPTFEGLMEIVHIEEYRKSESPSVLATLYGPSTLKIKQVHQSSLKLNEQTSKDSARIMAALADATRDRYTMYVAICE